MVIEWLKFKVDPERREEFIQKDAQIWTPLIANSAGFISKEVWIDPHDASQVVVVIRWESREQWYSFPKDLLDKTEAEFALAMGNSYQMIESGEYQVRKFPH
ncbi:MAG TPA: TIGR03792 family protein [Leptolyngbyaceae cyanobacterium]